MGYREDGNFNITWDYDGNYTPEKYANQNPDFLFPDKGIRFLEAQAALDRKMGRDNVISNGNFKLHRGYIRNLEQPAFGNMPVVRCNFQFNPQQIQQMVQMREDVYLPMLQPPQQLAQPLGANVNFNFDLFFDRSHELSAGNAPDSTPGFIFSSSPDKTSPNDPYDIGVMADLRVFYSVIGQGFSKEMFDFQAKMFKYNADRESENSGASVGSSPTSNSDATSDTSLAPTTPQTASTADIQDLINSNIGNFALLMPMPVRVMFSSLFMVDGFISGTNVDFLKFSTKMVPVQCRITVSMNALYIGFAREKTYLTDTFDRAAAFVNSQNAALEQQRQELLTALNKSCRNFIIGASYEFLEGVGWDDAASLHHNRELPVWRLANNNNDIGKNLFLGFPDIKRVKGGDLVFVIGGEAKTIKDGADEDYILALYENGVQVNFSYNWSINVWGRKPGVAGYAALTEAAATHYMNTGEGTGIKLLGAYSGTETSASKDEWGSGSSGDGAKAERIRRRSIRLTKFINSAADAYIVETAYAQGGANGSLNPSTGNEDWGTSNYFVIEINVDFSVSSGGGEPFTASYTSKQVKSGTQDFDRKIVLNWEAGVVLSDTGDSTNNQFLVIPST
jgi:hypothetical protein